MHGDEKETVDPNWNMTPRQMFQLVGTDMFRDSLSAHIPALKNENIWIKSFMQWYLLTSHAKIVVSDIRFEDEAKMINELGGFVILLKRKSSETTGRVHKSEELKIDSHELTITNDGTLFDLRMSAIHAIRRIHKLHNEKHGTEASESDDSFVDLDDDSVIFYSDSSF